MEEQKNSTGRIFLNRDNITNCLLSKALGALLTIHKEINMKNIYLIAAIIGAIIPCLFFIQYIQLNGINLLAFISALFVNGAAGGFSADLLISSFVFWIFMYQQWKVSNAPKPWLFILLNLGIGLSCALPAYLYIIEKSKNVHSA